MSEPKRRRRPPAGLVKEKWKPEPPVWDGENCETEFYGSFLHVSLSCIFAFLVAAYRIPDRVPNIIDIGFFFANFFFFLYLSYAILAGLSCLFGKK